MDPETWERLGSIFHHALTLVGSDRESFLDGACVGRPDLRREVEAVLRAHEDGDSSEDVLLDEMSTPALAGPVMGAQFGPYRIEELVGQGGMGEVYRAVRTDNEFHRQVAIKILRRNRTSEEMVRRFRLERQILARLEHPNIAMLLEGGVTETGQPYLVMQYVAGTAITAFADRQHLSIPERLRLFVTVCQAVQFAHQKLVVHRDIKPANILVTEDGQVRLLDFGIAKLIDPLDADTDTTAPITGDLLLLTPEHAAPEQFLGDSVTTSTDVYALGVLLHQLLTGLRPFQMLPAPEFHRAVCERDPLPPAAIARESYPDGASGDPTARAAARGTDPTALSRTLTGDLDAIVLQALRKEPSRRYQSAGQLAEDIGRYLEGRPIIARPDTVGYRARKFVGRNRLTVAIASAATVLLIGATATTAVQSERRAAALVVAEAERTKASRVTDFMIGVFDANNPIEARGRSLTARELLDRASERVGEDRSLGPGVRADLQLAMGRAYLALGHFEPANRIFDQVIELRTAEPSRDDAALATVAEWSSRAKAAAGELREAVARSRQALQLEEKVFGPSSLASARTMIYLAKVYRSIDILDRGDTARRLLDQALTIERAAPAPDQREIAEIFRTRGVLSMDQERNEQSLADLRSAVGIGRAAVGDDHPFMFNLYEDLALGLDASGQRDSAIAIHRRLLTARERIFGPDHMDVSYSVFNLARELGRAGQFDEALPLFRRAVAMRIRAVGETHYAVCYALHSYAVATAQSGDLDGAADRFDRAAAVCEAALDSQATAVQDAFEGLAIVRAMQHHDVAAIRALEQAAQHGYRRPGRLRQEPFDRLAGNPRFARVLSAMQPDR